MTKIALEINGINHFYGRTQTLTDVSLSCEQNKMLAILGPNGSGKTTLFKLISTLLKPHSGAIKIHGVDVVQNPDEIRKMIGIVFQSSSLDKRLTVQENLMHSGHLYGMYGNSLKNRIAQLNDKLNLEKHINDRLETLSGGYQRRIELARCLLHNPKFLLFDEPTTSLDPGIRNDFWNLVTTVMKENESTIVFTTHLIEEAEKTDKVVIMHEGMIVACDSPNNLRSDIENEMMTIISNQPEELAGCIKNRYKIALKIDDDKITFETENGGKIIGEILSEYNSQINSISLSKTNLENVFFHKTGSRWV